MRHVADLEFKFFKIRASHNITRIFDELEEKLVKVCCNIDALILRVEVFVDEDEV